MSFRNAQTIMVADTAHNRTQAAQADARVATFVSLLSAQIAAANVWAATSSGVADNEAQQ